MLKGGFTCAMTTTEQAWTSRNLDKKSVIVGLWEARLVLAGNKDSIKRWLDGQEHCRGTKTKENIYNRLLLRHPYFRFKSHKSKLTNLPNNKTRLSNKQVLYPTTIQRKDVSRHNASALDLPPREIKDGNLPLPSRPEQPERILRLSRRPDGVRTGMDQTATIVRGLPPARNGWNSRRTRLTYPKRASADRADPGAENDRGWSTQACDDENRE